MKNVDTILTIDDEIQIRRLLEITLSACGYKIVTAFTGKEGLLLAASHQPSLIILDLGLPDMDGMNVLKKLREWFHKPVIILSVRNSEEDIIYALDNGANDYLTKPFRTGELLARIRASLRLSHVKNGISVFQVADLSVDMTNHIAKKKDEILNLTPTEFVLLSLFIKNQGCVLTHQYILKEIRGYGYAEQTQYLRVFVAQLRKKIEDNPAKPALLITESGIGYRFGI
ncbi:MAG: response regulator [Dysgonamonadaceae bacterium]|jgi:two-component system KDP operon response regulator KdpE|nr:response regulator [Dysgonamonadaceae bacterium]